MKKDTCEAATVSHCRLCYQYWNGQKSIGIFSEGGRSDSGTTTCVRSSSGAILIRRPELSVSKEGRCWSVIRWHSGSDACSRTNSSRRLARVAYQPRFSPPCLEWSRPRRHGTSPARSAGRRLPDLHPVPLSRGETWHLRRGAEHLAYIGQRSRTPEGVNATVLDVHERVNCTGLRPNAVRDGLF